MKIYKNKKKQNRISLIILIVFSILLIFSSINIVKWLIDKYNSQDVMNKVNKNIKTTEIDDNENTELINPDEDKNSDYWYFTKFKLTDVDFSELIIKNKDTVGWLNVNNTNINYPVVQANDNDYYLSHSFDKSYNQAGWVFLDYRNNKEMTNKNNIIYAHSRFDNTMFGSLNNVLYYSWYSNKDNYIIRISTNIENTLWQIFSVYKIETESYYITTNFFDNDDFNEFISTIKKRSIYDFNTSVNTEDRILTLSTCYSDTERTVVHAKLIKKENR